MRARASAATVAWLVGWLVPASVAALEGGQAAPAPVPVPAGGAPDAPARLTITSDSDCPSGVAITSALSELAPSGQGPSGAVRVRAAGDKLIVDLVSDAVTQRELAVTGDCATRATTVALVIATWTGELSSAATTEPSLPPAILVPDVPPAPAPVPPMAPPVSERELGAGLLLSLSDGPAPGVEMDYVQTRAPRGLGWQAGLVLPARRESSSSGLSTRWTRMAGNVAVNLRTTVAPVALSASAGLVGAYTLISARGYSFEQNARAFTLGAAVEARVAIPWGSLRVWSALRGCRWLLPQSVMIETQGGDRVATVDLPSWDFQWALGLSYLFR